MAELKDCEKDHKDRMQEKGKKQEEVESTRTGPIFHRGIFFNQEDKERCYKVQTDELLLLQ